MPISVNIEVLVGFAGAVALGFLLLGAVRLHKRAHLTVHLLVMGSHGCFATAAAAMLAPETFGVTPAAFLTIGGLYFGVALGYFATMRQAGASSRVIPFVALGLLMVAAQTAIASGDASVRALMLTSSFTNPPLFLIMGVMVWRATASLGARVAVFAAAPFVALGLAYLARFGGLFVFPDQGLYEAATAIILIMIAGTAFAWTWTLGAIREALETRVISRARSVAESASQAKSDFLRSMSHELRTPLNAVIGLAQLMDREALGPVPGPYRPHVRNILTSGRHLLSLIEDLLDLSAIEAGEMVLAEEDIPVDEVVSTVVALLDQRAENAGVALRVSPPETPVAIRGDRRRITQVLLNLTANAVKYSPSGADVTLTWMTEAEGTPLLTVRDTGPGMTEEELAEALRLFGRVARDGKQMIEGTGIGLPLARDLAEAHGGTLTLRSAPGTGTTAEVRLPPERRIDMPTSETDGFQAAPVGSAA